MPAMTGGLTTAQFEGTSPSDHSTIGRARPLPDGQEERVAGEEGFEPSIS